VDFRRARTEQQRTERRRTILATAAAMLAEMPAAQISLNELSKRVGLARSNVLRYFESREAILLELLDRELADAVAELQAVPTAASAGLHDRVGRVADAIATTVAARPVLCDLVAAQAAVLERHVSTEVVLRHKRATRASVHALTRYLRSHVPELTDQQAVEVVVLTVLLVAGAWPHGQPTEALRAAYASDPTVADSTIDFADVVRRSVQLTLLGELRAGQPGDGARGA
jgi:AcrR family transcriptional regulator